MSKLVHGVGINDKTKTTWIDGKTVKEYVLWAGMLERCFTEKCQDKHPTYKGCSVSDNFLHYSFFYDWCQEQVGFKSVDEKGRNWCLDKDILFVGNKLYSETTCVFVPQEINTFFVNCCEAIDGYPIGVSLEKTGGRYRAQCRVAGKNKNLGRYPTPEQAFDAYKPFKEAICKELALKWKGEIDARLFEAMMKWEVNYDYTTHYND